MKNGTGGASIRPVEAKSLKAACVETLERLVISGELAVGELIPPERDLARRLGVSRPVVHEAMVELAAKGFVSVEPRREARVSDFWRDGTLAIFESIVLHNEGTFPTGTLRDLVAFRALIELEAVRLAAASGGGPDGVAALEALLAEEAVLPADAAEARVELDIRFHLLLARASGNRVLPLVLNSVVPIYRTLIRRFYATSPDIAAVRAFHAGIVAAVRNRDVDTALLTARAMLDHGAAAIGAG